MSDDTTLHRHVRELLASGRLPQRRPDRVWGGMGAGRERCVVCGELVSTGQTALEAEFRDGDGSRSHALHVPCFWALESQWERLDHQQKSAVSSSGDSPGRAPTGT
jgi:hypothetical protein